MLSDTKLIFIILSAIILFLYGLEQFSKEIGSFVKDKYREKFEKFVTNRYRGFLTGLLFTAAVQSSSASSALAVSLVDAGLISFRNSLAILFGSNVGTTLTAQMVAFKLTGIGPYLITIGSLMSLIFPKHRPIGRIIFYFGFIFFTLDLISSSLEPIRTSDVILSWLQEPRSSLYGVAIGALVTFMVQSSSVTTGLIVILVGYNSLDLVSASYMILGANIGTTGTALLASAKLSKDAKVAALANSMFNFGGAILFWPLMPTLANEIIHLTSDAAKGIAWIHLIFNVGTSLLFLIFLKPFADFVQTLGSRYQRRKLDAYLKTDKTKNKEE